MGATTSSSSSVCGSASGIETGHLDSSGVCRCSNSNIGGTGCADIKTVTIVSLVYPQNWILVGSPEISKTNRPLPTDTLIKDVKTFLLEALARDAADAPSYDFFVQPQYGAILLNDNDALSAYLLPTTTRCDSYECTLYVGIQPRGVCTGRDKAACQSGFDEVLRGGGDPNPNDQRPGYYYKTTESDPINVQQGMAWTCDYCGDTEETSSCVLSSNNNNVSYDIVRKSSGVDAFECKCVTGPGGAFNTRAECKAAIQGCQDRPGCEDCSQQKGCIICANAFGEMSACIPEKLKGQDYCISEGHNPFVAGVDFPPQETNAPLACWRTGTW